ncbi:MAG TPA: hypothetical protein VI958_04030, partial [Acidobacteriota bacterium]
TWIVFMILAAFCLVVGMITGRPKTKTLLPVRLNSENNIGPDWPDLQGALMASTPQVLNEWNETAITAQLRQLRNEKPALIPHFVESITERLIIRQDDRTAQTRLAFLRT